MYIYRGIVPDLEFYFASVYAGGGGVQRRVRSAGTVQQRLRDDYERVFQKRSLA